MDANMGNSSGINLENTHLYEYIYDHDLRKIYNILMICKCS
jgi:hypothetical protein